MDSKSYWFDEASGKVLRLVGACDAEAASALHQEAADGLMADEIVPAREGA